MRRRLGVGWAGGLAIAAIAALWPPAAHADAGIPMLPVQYPQLLLYVLPVILIEAVYLKRQLRTRLRRTVIAVTLVNLITVALGYPLAWGIYSLLDSLFGFPVLGSSVFMNMWRLPIWVSAKMFPAWAGLPQGIWVVLVAWVVLLIPSFLLSGLVKSWLVEWYDLLDYKGKARRAVWTANRYSYFFLTATGCALLYMVYSQM